MEDGAVDEAYLARVADETARVRGIEFEAPVAHRLLDEEGTRAYLAEVVERDVDPRELRAEQRGYEALGLIKPGVQLEQVMTDLHAEQAAAFYDPRVKTFFLIDKELPGSDGSVAFLSWLLERDLVGEFVVSHELVHALQDQAYDLIAFYTQVADGDEALARRSLVEGEAVWYALLVVLAGQASPHELQDLEFDQETALTGSEGEAFERAPRILQESLIFPYVAGFAFLQETIAAGELLWTRPPRSSEQILHPEKYLADEGPRRFAVVPVDRPGWSLVTEGVLGELGLRVLLCGDEEGTPLEAREAAAGWGGDRYVVYEQGPEGPLALAWLLSFDSPADTDEFLTAFRELRPDAECVRAGETRVEVVRCADPEMRAALQAALAGAREVVAEESASESEEAAPAGDAGEARDAEPGPASGE